MRICHHLKQQQLGGSIFRSPKSYGITLPKLPNKPQTGFVKIYNPIDFYTLSVLSDVKLETLYFLNPGFSAWYIIPSMQNKVLLPINKIKKFKERYKKYRTIMFKEKIHTDSQLQGNKERVSLLTFLRLIAAHIVLIY